VDIGASAELELVDKFCYLFDILSVQATGYASQHKSVPVQARINWEGYAAGRASCIIWGLRGGTVSVGVASTGTVGASV